MQKISLKGLANGLNSDLKAAILSITPTGTGTLDTPPPFRCKLAFGRRTDLRNNVR
jgi:hypothetical protein